MIILDNIEESPYAWTPPMELSNGNYAIKLNDSMGRGRFTPTFTISDGAGRGRSMNLTAIESGSNHNGSHFNSSMSTDQMEKEWGLKLVDDPSNMPQGAIIGIAVGGGLGLAIVTILVIVVWIYRKKYIDTTQRYGDLLREVYGEKGSRNGEAPKLATMTPIPEVNKPDDEFDAEAEIKKADRERMIAEHQARTRKSLTAPAEGDKEPDRDTRANGGSNERIHDWRNDVDAMTLTDSNESK